MTITLPLSDCHQNLQSPVAGTCIQRVQCKGREHFQRCSLQQHQPIGYIKHAAAAADTCTFILHTKPGIRVLCAGARKAKVMSINGILIYHPSR